MYIFVQCGDSNALFTHYISKKDDGWLAFVSHTTCPTLPSLHGSYSHATEVVMADRERKSGGQQKDAMLSNQEGGGMPLLKESWIILRQFL